MLQCIKANNQCHQAALLADQIPLALVPLNLFVGNNNRHNILDVAAQTLLRNPLKDDWQGSTLSFNSLQAGLPFSQQGCA